MGRTNRLIRQYFLPRSAASQNASPSCKTVEIFERAEPMSPETPAPGEITRILQHWKAGDRGALAGVAALAYNDLRAIAAGILRHEDSSHTLQATGLVNEIYLRLAKVRRTLYVLQGRRASQNSASSNIRF